jgi:hypothetical protein
LLEYAKIVEKSTRVPLVLEYDRSLAWAIGSQSLGQAARSSLGSRAMASCSLPTYYLRPEI